MLCRRWYVLMIVILACRASLLKADEAQPPSSDEFQEDVPPFEEEEVSDLESEGLLDYSQEERRFKFNKYIAFDIGNVNPWQFFGLSLSWSSVPNHVWTAGLGGGKFEITDTHDGTNYQVKFNSRVVNLAYRHYFTDFASFYYEGSGQINFWDGVIRPRGTEESSAEASQTLTSDFSHYGLSMSFKFGYTWFWETWGLDISILQFSRSHLLDETYTNNTKAARENVQEQLQSSHSWAGVNLRIIKKLD